MNYQHKELAKGRWFELDLVTQLANVGSEVERAILWKDRNKNYSKEALYRALELLELTLNDKKNRKYSILKELCRLKEILLDFFCADNKFASSDELMKKYFYAFIYMARHRR
jgi:hypothetical protein